MAVNNKITPFKNSYKKKSVDPDDIYANFKSNGECAMGNDITDDIRNNIGYIPPPPSGLPPPPPPPPPGLPPPPPKYLPPEEDHTFKIARRQPPPPVNGEIYKQISEFSDIILGCKVKSMYILIYYRISKDVWIDSILVNIAEKELSNTSGIIIPKYTVIDIITEKSYELISDQIYLLKSELDHCIEINKDIENKEKKWCEGMQCKARYSVDFQWYPAIIIKVNKEITYVTVVFAGYLNKETLPISFICPINANPSVENNTVENGHETVDIVYNIYFSQYNHLVNGQLFQFKN